MPALPRVVSVPPQEPDDVGQDLTDEQAAELTKLAADLVARFTVGAGSFCHRHARPDPKERDLTLLIVMELVFAELLDLHFVGDENRLGILRHLSHNVHAELRSREQTRRAQKGKFDA